MKWTGHVARVVNRVGAHGRNLRERLHSEDLGVDGRITLK